MVSYGRRRLAWKLIFVILLFSTALTLAVSAIQITMERDRDMAEVESHIRQIRDSHLSSMAKNVWLADDERLGIQLVGIRNLPDIEFVEVRNPSGVVAAVGKISGKDNFLKTLPLFHSEQGRKLEIGTVTIGVSLKDIRAKTAERIWFILVTNAVYVSLTAFFIYFAANYLIMRHLGHISDYFRDIASDELETELTLSRRPCPEGKEDELGRLVAGINQMRENLQQSFGQMKRLNEELEARVEKRTRELHRQEEYFRLVLDQALVGIISTDELGDIRSINEAAEQIFGYKSGEVVGQNVSVLIPGDDGGAHHPFLEKSEKSGPTSVLKKGREVDALHKDGSAFTALLAVSRLKNRGQRIFTGIVRDITQEKKLEQDMLKAKKEAEASSQAKSEFLASMSHELRTPLNAIIGFASTMSMEVFGPLSHNKYAEYVSDIHGSGQHLLELINDILDVSAIEAGKLELIEEELDVGQLVLTSLRLINQRAQNNGVKLIFPKLENMPRIWADERRVKQILLNLLSNAVKFTPEKGKVVMEVKTTRDGLLVFRVRDTGIGMTDEDIKVALTPFGQVDSSLARKFEGSGLGLPLTNALVLMHGGTMKIASEKGKGTTVTVKFPKDRIVE